MTAVLRHAKGFPLLGLLSPLRHVVTASVAADPVLQRGDPVRKTDDHASDVHIVVRMTVDRRFLLYARQAQTQCPRRWLVASTPLARAVWPHQKPFHRSVTGRLPNVSPHLRRLTGCARYGRFKQRFLA